MIMAEGERERDDEGKKNAKQGPVENTSDCVEGGWKRGEELREGSRVQNSGEECWEWESDGRASGKTARAGKEGERKMAQKRTGSASKKQNKNLFFFTPNCNKSGATGSFTATGCLLSAFWCIRGMPHRSLPSSQLLMIIYDGDYHVGKDALS